MHIASAWKNASAAVRGAVIGGIAVLVAAILPLVWPHLTTPSTLNIADVEAVQAQGRCTIDVVIVNKAPNPQTITSMMFDMGQENVLDVIGTSTYRITHAAIDATTGGLHGELKEDGTPQISLSVSGYLKLHASGAWELRVLVPVQEGVAASDGRRIILTLPDTISVDGLAGLPPFWAGLRTDGILAGPPNRLYLYRFLQGRGEMGVKVDAAYASGKTTAYRGSLVFPK